ncbi:ATP/GTP-binding protein [uncultured Bacteroides sp.]|uniref:TRAFAC clade GTPase domain-containing protein n=1 Tax=uncultured Bacteroides sp. TaxID=162156 RepID=UPI00263386F3|nr:ATP/GTP-binding protein [uncultured Bacteroides sp.]
MGKIKILCPYCFQSFYNNEVMLQCENENTTATGEPKCGKESNVKFSEFWGNEVQTKHIFSPKTGFMSSLLGYTPKPEKCDRCGYSSKRFVCPHCNNWLPTEMIEKGSEIISVIGGPASGKTTYIISLIHEIRKYGYKVNLQVTPQQVGRNKSEYTYNKFKEAEQMLFEDKTIVPKTQITSRSIPWILRLESHKSKKAVYLVFYDTAGESFNSAEDMARNARYLSESLGVIVLFDTLSIKKIKAMIEGKGFENDGVATPFDTTASALYNFATDNKALYKKPFAFVMSKFDTIRENKLDVDMNLAPFAENSSFIKTGKFSLEEVENAHQAIKAALEDPDLWDEGQLAADINNNWKDNYKFFGVSALGQMVQDGMLSQEVKPFRVMDPLLWVLNKIGGFDIPTE